MRTSNLIGYEMSFHWLPFFKLALFPQSNLKTIIFKSEHTSSPLPKLQATAPGIFWEMIYQIN